ncbi:MAG: hypothetical protein U9Q33_11395 [Campylobacterota bacterium]|nr:hypothetical protein [Campylobacterota bacterium]
MIIRTSMVLVEVILSVVLFSIVLLYSLNVTLTVYEKNNKELNYATTKLKLETARLFLLKHKDLSKLLFVDNILFYDNNILIDNVISFNIQEESNNIKSIDITVDDLTQNWKIK